MSVQNQRIIQIAKREVRDKNHLYAIYNQESMKQAMNKLKGSGLKMWLYINKNRDNYRFDLSRQACKEWGIKKDSYYDGFNDLVNNGYLRLSHPGSNVYYFHENGLAENSTSGYSEFYFTDKTKPYSVNQNERYEIPNGTAVNPERNNINNTRILQNNTSSDCSGMTEAEWRKKFGF